MFTNYIKSVKPLGKKKPSNMPKCFDGFEVIKNIAFIVFALVKQQERE